MIGSSIVDIKKTNKYEKTTIFGFLNFIKRAVLQLPKVSIMTTNQKSVVVKQKYKHKKTGGI